MFQNRVAGDSITVTKSPFYYEKKNVHLDKIVFKVENDAAAAAAALKAGDLQALDGIDSTQLAGHQGDKKLRIVKQTGLGYQGLTLNIGNKNGLLKCYSNVGTPIAASADLRKAFEMAIDRKAMNKSSSAAPSCRGARRSLRRARGTTRASSARRTTRRRRRSSSPPRASRIRPCI